MKKTMAVAVIVSVLLMAASSQAAITPVVQADLNGNRGTADTGPVHAGWTGISGTETYWGPWTHSYSINGIAIDLSVGYGNSGWRNRGTPTAGTLSDMYQSLLFAAVGMDLKLSGLTVGTQYQFNIYSWDSGGGSTNTGNAHWNYSLAGDKSSPVDAGYLWQPNTATFTPAANTDTTVAGKGTGLLTTTFTATGSAVDFFVVSGNSAPVIALNGIELYLIPEPATIFTIFGVAVPMLLKRKAKA